jgi:SpoVK/Ycf46/Vps4 family AAA+-type ATPase
VVEKARNRAAAQGHPHITGADLIATAADAFLPDMGPLAQRIPVRRGWDDLVIPDEAATLLQELVAQVDRREEVLEALGRGNVRDGERGVKALFSGPPGTGKSLSAEVIAGALGYPLFRVDLASVVSKWVGETEKHLNRLFEAVEEAPCVLLFDEADALFGKRADVKGAQDRFANLEVSYLLQRIESFDGIAVLTTNLKRNIDEAFLRRFTFVVDFPFPEAEQRWRIWQRVLPASFPLADDVDLRAVAVDFKLAGANIWSVAVAAACEAAATPDRSITRQMLAHAVLREYQKLGREVSALRPSMLAGASPSTDDGAKLAEARRKLRTPAMSAAEARRRREAPGADAGD